MTTRIMTIKWTTSTERETEGWNICTLYDGTRKVARCIGGGYDMIGTVWGNYIAEEFAPRLALIQDRVWYRWINNQLQETHLFNPTALYGFSTDHDGKPVIDGACGIESVLQIAEAIGVHPKFSHENEHGDQLWQMDVDTWEPHETVPGRQVNRAV